MHIRPYWTTYLKLPHVWMSHQLLRRRLSPIARLSRTSYSHCKHFKCSSLCSSLSSSSLSSSSGSDWAQYERMSPIQHVLLRPGMYIGNTSWVREEHWLFDEQLQRMRKQKIHYCPALLKIFDEILVNAADNYRRSASTSTTTKTTMVMAMTTIDISAVVVNSNALCITVRNDGNGIPVVKHEEEGIYVPELIFGHLLTGSNFNDSSQRFTGGSHGYGAKLTNIFSTDFSVSIVDHANKIQYKQSWNNNMQNIQPPSVSKISNLKQLSSSQTSISFSPDLSKFGISNQNLNPEETERLNDMVKFFKRRAFDIAGCLNGGVKVRFNDELIPILNFQEYCKAFEGDDQVTEEGKAIKTVKIDQRWEVGLLPSSTKSFETVSFVNSVWTPKGGSHVNTTIHQIVDVIQQILSKRNIPASLQLIKNNLMILINCQVANASFEGQTKDSLLTSPSNFGSDYVFAKKQLKEMVEKSGVLERIIEDYKILEESRLQSLTNGKVAKRKVALDVPKLEDAHFAGSDNALKCTLIITEGDSAKALAVAGLSVVGREYYGVMPLRGKLLNVKSATKYQISNNEEIGNLCKAIGLDFSKSYDRGIEGQNMRYGKIMLMCDQDHDGSHIKGLIINFLHRFWPNLLKIDGFLQEFVTPIVKVRDHKGNVIQNFYSLYEYQQWLDEFGFDGKTSTISAGGMGNGDGRRQKVYVKYYKGLGTSTADEGTEYFANIERHRKDFVPSLLTSESGVDQGDIDGAAIDLLFSKDRSKERKDWLLNSYAPSLQLDLSNTNKLTFKDFIDKELIHFSFSDNLRSIPSVIDGLKPSQRKVLFGCFSRFQTTNQESKLVQLAGYIAEKSSYHHGEASLHSTLINMAQSFVGSNNVPLIEGVGQFGTRSKGGQDHASPRYIFARLSPVARRIFPKEDDDQLQYLEEDGESVEPKFYYPVVPYLLVNGTQGIGTGWSTKIPSFNIIDLVDWLQELLSVGKQTKPLTPWYRKFKGTTTKMRDDSSDFLSTGIARRINKTTIEITELPIEKWTEDYKESLHKLVENGFIKSFQEFHGTEDVKFVISASKAAIDNMEADGLVQSLKLTSSINLTNMHAFSMDERIKKYSSPQEIIEEYFPIRLSAYERRKENLLNVLAQDAKINESRLKFVEDIISRRLNLFEMSASSDDAVNAEMHRCGYMSWSSIGKQEGNNADRSKDFDYLLKMPLQSLSSHQVQALHKSKLDSQQKLEVLQRTKASTLWMDDLEALRKACNKMK